MLEETHACDHDHDSDDDHELEQVVVSQEKAWGAFGEKARRVARKAKKARISRLKKSLLRKLFRVRQVEFWKAHCAEANLLFADSEETRKCVVTCASDSSALLCGQLCAPRNNGYMLGVGVAASAVA